MFLSTKSYFLSLLAVLQMLKTVGQDHIHSQEEIVAIVSLESLTLLVTHLVALLLQCLDQVIFPFIFLAMLAKVLVLL